MVHKQKSVWLQKTDAGGPEKLVINFVWPNGILCIPPPPPLTCLHYSMHYIIDILVECYSPLGNPQNPYLNVDEPVLMEDPVIKEIASKHRVSIAQVIILYSSMKTLKWSNKK